MSFYDRFLVRGKPINEKISGSDWVYGVLDIIEVMPNPLGAKSDDMEAQNLYKITRRKPNFSADWNLPYPQEHIFVKYESIGKYTQRKDVSGNKAFEGDIIEYTENGYYYNALIFYNGRFGTWYYVDEYGFSNSLNYIHDFEIVGNAFENPELLTKYMRGE